VLCWRGNSGSFLNQHSRSPSEDLAVRLNTCSQGLTGPHFYTSCTHQTAISPSCTDPLPFFCDWRADTDRAARAKIAKMRWHPTTSSWAKVQPRWRNSPKPTNTRESRGLLATNPAPVPGFQRNKTRPFAARLPQFLEASPGPSWPTILASRMLHGFTAHAAQAGGIHCHGHRVYDDLATP